MATINTDYEPVSAEHVPASARFDTPAAHQGQIVEISYSSGRSREQSEAGLGELYQRIEDHSLPVDDPERVRFLKRVGPMWLV